MICIYVHFMQYTSFENQIMPLSQKLRFKLNGLKKIVSLYFLLL